MQTIVRGPAIFFSGEFEDKQNKKVPYHQLCITEVSLTGVNLIKATVSVEKVEEARKFDGQVTEVICDVKETNYNGKQGLKMVYVNARPYKAA